MTRPSLFLDIRPARTLQQAALISAQAAASTAPSWVLGVVQATHEQEEALPVGWARVGIPHDHPTTEATGMTDGGVTAIGAVVKVQLDGAGRVVSISSPIILPDGARVIATGVVGAEIQARKAELAASRAAVEKALAKADGDLKAAGERVARVEEGLSDANAQAERVAQEGVRLREQVVEQARRVGSLEDAAQSVEERVSAAARGAEDAKRAAAEAQTAQQQIRESVAQAEREAAQKAEAAEKAAKRYADGLKDSTLTEAQRQALRVAQAEAEKAKQAAGEDLERVRQQAETVAGLAEQAKRMAEEAERKAAAAAEAQAQADTRLERAEAALTAQEALNKAAKADLNRAQAAAVAAQAAADALATGLREYWPNPHFSEGLPLIGKKSTEAAPVGQARLIDLRDHFGSQPRPYFELHAGYVINIQVTAKRLRGSKPLLAGIHTHTVVGSSTGQNWHNALSATPTKQLSNGWAVYSGQWTVPSNVVEGRVWISIDQPNSGGDTAWLISNLRVRDVTSLAAAQATANTAADKAVKAQQKADLVETKAATTQRTLDTVQGTLTTLGRNVRVSKNRPGASDGANTPTGGLWFVEKPGTLGETWKWDGKAWHQLKAGADFLQQGVFGAVHARAGFLAELTAAHGVLGSANIGMVTAEKLRSAIGALDRGFIQSLITDTGFIRHLFTERISIAAGSLFPDSLFQDKGSWAGNTGAISWKTDAAVSGNVLVIKAMKSQQGVYYQPAGHADSSMSLTPGRTYRLSMMVRFPSFGGSAPASVYLRHHQANGSVHALRIVRITDALRGAPNAWTRLESQFTLPATDKNGACTLGIYGESTFTSGSMEVAEVRVEEAVGSTLIEPNSITTPMLKATSDMWAKLLTVAGNATIGGNLIANASITAPHIVASSALSAKVGEFLKVTSQMITVGALDGVTITGATMQTSKSGARVVLDSTGLKALNSANKITFSIDAHTGRVRSEGEFGLGDNWSWAGFTDAGNATNGWADFGAMLYFQTTDSKPKEQGCITLIRGKDKKANLLLCGVAPVGSSASTIYLGSNIIMNAGEGTLFVHGDGIDYTHRADKGQAAFYVKEKAFSLNTGLWRTTGVWGGEESVVLSYAKNRALAIDNTGMGFWSGKASSLYVTQQQCGMTTIEWNNTGFWADANNTVVGYSSTVSLFLNSGGMHVRGSKNFVMRVPGESKRRGGKLLRHAATESPHDGVEYWEQVTLDADGHGTWVLPHYVPAIAAPKAPWIALASTQDGSPVAARLIQDEWGPDASPWRVTLHGTPGSVTNVLVKGARLLEARPNVWEDRTDKDLWVTPPESTAATHAAGERMAPVPPPPHHDE